MQSVDDSEWVDELLLKDMTDTGLIKICGWEWVDLV